MIRQTEVDGVPTLIAPTAGPMHAGLIFRVGRADETLPQAGITHLLEHLVLHPLGPADYHYNGVTAPVMTYFHMHGPEKDVAGFLSGVCDTLRSLPMQRLETEKAILRTEAGTRSAHVTEPMALWRHGARGHGLVSYPEWGLPMITPDDLEAWSARWFTRDNAVLWIAGPDVPAGLRLNLPAGERRPVPAASSALPTTPAFFSGDSRAVALDAVVRRRTSAWVFSGVLERELFRGLRQEAGLSYTAGSDYTPRGDGSAVVSAIADALPEKQDAVLGGFVDVLAKMRVGRIEPADVDAVVAKHADLLGNAEAHAARLPSQAFALLTGEALRTADEVAADLVTVTAADVHEVAVEALDSALLMVPDGRTADWAGFTAAPSTSPEPVTGTAYRSLNRASVRLVTGPEGVSLADDTINLTVRYDRCAAVLGWPDGRRQLIGHDGINVGVEPTLYAGAAAAVAAIDVAAPADLRIAMPARDPESIPQPDPDRDKVPGPGHPDRIMRIAGLVVMSVTLLALAGFIVVLAVGLVVAPEPGEGDLWIIVVAGALLVAWLTRLMLLSARQLRRGVGWTTSGGTGPVQHP